MRLVSYQKVQKEYKTQYRNNKEITEFYDKCIYLMLQISEDILKKKIKEFTKTKTHLTGSGAINDLYQIKIIHNFSAHQDLLKNGIVLGSYLHLRTIYESIIKTYLGITQEELGELNFKMETIFKDEKTSAAEKKEIWKRFIEHEYLRPNYIERTIYDGDQLIGVRKFYRMISSISHPSISSLASCFEYKPETFIDSIKLGIGLTSSNFILLLELNKKKIAKKYVKKMFALSKKYPYFIPEGIPVLIPTINKEKLFLIDYNSFIDILEKHGK
jgi:hypothetical protein